MIFVILPTILIYHFSFFFFDFVPPPNPGWAVRTADLGRPPDTRRKMRCTGSILIWIIPSFNIHGLLMGIYYVIWLVVWTPLKNISQLGWLFPIYGKIKNVPNHQPVIIYSTYTKRYLPTLHVDVDDVWGNVDQTGPPWSIGRFLRISKRARELKRSQDHTMWGPQTIAQLAHITAISLLLMMPMTIVNGC